MGEKEFLKPKTKGNDIRARVLQKLRWYCEVCGKQCRDEDGFKIHCMSQSHQHEVQLFEQNPNWKLDAYSERFENDILEHLRRSRGFNRVAATAIFCEYMMYGNNHIPLFATRWLTLTEFVKHLGRTGKCEVEETPHGWFITYIDTDV